MATGMPSPVFVGLKPDPQSAFVGRHSWRHLGLRFDRVDRAVECRVCQARPHALSHRDLMCLAQHVAGAVADDRVTAREGGQRAERGEQVCEAGKTCFACRELVANAGLEAPAEVFDAALAHIETAFG